MVSVLLTIRFLSTIRLIPVSLDPQEKNIAELY